MHILCTICSDLVNPAENIHVTKCGHIFHYHCLAQWIARSKSCPQCRNKVTEKCVYRIYPTISNEATVEDAATLQSRLDDAQLQLRQQRASCKEQEDKCVAVEAEMKKKVALLKATEKKLESKECAAEALQKQLEYIKIENKETQKLKQENESLRNKMQTLNGLEKVLNATIHEVEQMLESYTDVRTVATFATALKRALCDSEHKKNESRDKLQTLKQELLAEKNINAELQTKLLLTEEKLTKYKNLIIKRKKEIEKQSDADDSLAVKKKKPNEDLNSAIVQTENNTSITTMVNRIETADSPYLCLKQSNPALTALQRLPRNPIQDTNLKPSEYALLNSARNTVKKPDSNQTSIFHQKEPLRLKLSQENDLNEGFFNMSYDGLGGHSKLDTFPTPKQPLKNLVPKLSAKHKLKRPSPGTNQDIGQMLKKIKDKL